MRKNQNKFITKRQKGLKLGREKNGQNWVNKIIHTFWVQKSKDRLKKSISKLLDENNKVIKEQRKYLTQLRTTMKKIIRRKKQMKFHKKIYIFDTKLIPYKYFRHFGKNWLIFSMNIEYKKNKDYLRYIPDFYKEILQTWIKMGGVKQKRYRILQRLENSLYGEIHL